MATEATLSASDVGAPKAASRRLKITEIFRSIQGESSYAGWPTVFVRLTGCPLRCVYCDTAYAFHGGDWMELGQVVTQVEQFRVRHVCVTGGEPLAQKGCLPLLKTLCDAGYQVSLETSGALDIREVDPRVARIVDLKTPASGEVHRNRWENVAELRLQDEVKFVICDEADYQWAKSVINEHDLSHRCTVLMSPSQGQLPPDRLADWIVDDALPVRFQMQLHKVLWGNVAGR